MIGRSLESLLGDAERDEFEVVVAANGCTDGTVDVARRAAPDAVVLDLPTAAKHAALNAGDRAATAFPRIFLDADVEVTTDSVRRVLAAVAASEGVACAAPRLRVDTSRSSAAVRRFYRVFEQLPYVTDGLVGLGFYLLTEDGRGRFDAFPAITADDLFVRNHFRPSERLSVGDATFSVQAPRTVRALLTVRQRVYRGNAEYADTGFPPSAEATRSWRRLAVLARGAPVDVAVYLGLNLVSAVQWRLRQRRAGATAWERDDTSREPTP